MNNAIISRHPTQGGYTTLSKPTDNNILYFVNTGHNSGCVWYMNVPPKKVGSYNTDLVKAVVKMEDGSFLAFDCSHGLDNKGRPLFRYEEDMEDFFDFHKEVLSQLDTLTESVVKDPSFTIVDEEEVVAIEPYSQCGRYAMGSSEYAGQNGFQTFNKGAIHHCIEITQGVETVTLKLWDGSHIVIGLYGDTNRLPQKVRFADLRTKDFTGEITVDGKKVDRT